MNNSRECVTTAARDAVVERMAWGWMYLGAFAALGITNTQMASELASLTMSRDECIHVIGLLRRAPEGDRVWPALAALREIRNASRDLDVLKEYAGTRDTQPPEAP
jgi:hypothetical protein